MILMLVIMAICVINVKGACLFNQYLDTSTCKYCYALFPGCHTCDINACSSCVEGLYFVQDQKVCVESCANVIIPSTSADQSKYFADNFARTCEKCGSDCSNCIDDYGCTNVLKDSSSSDSTSYSKSITNSKLQSTLCSSTYSSCKLCTSSTCTFCSGKLLSSGACSTACTDTHCRYCNSDSTICTLCADGYVLSSGLCVAKTCTVANCNDCTSSGATTCTTCKEGYLNGGTTCTACVSNCLQCSSSTTCDVCKPGYILASDSKSCVSACSSSQFVQVTKLVSPYGDAVDSRKCVACDSSCESCISTNAATSCTKCALGKFLTVTDSTQITGTCASKTAYSSASDIVIYVSNSDTDYAKSASSILGTQANPDIDLPTALLRAQQMVAPYTTKSDGSNLRVNIVLYKGDHYMLRKNIVPFLGFIDSYSYNYEIKITPMYCTTFPTDTTHCYTTGTDQVNIYSKLGPELAITIPKIMTIENILFQLIDGFIPSQNDPDSCLTTRKKCCTWDSTNKIIAKVSSSQTETCTQRTAISQNCHRASKHNMMNFAPYSAKYGLSSPPQLVLTSTTFADVYYEMNSLADFNIGGYVTVTGSTFLRFSTCGAVFKNTNPSIINSNTDSSYYTTYVNNFNLRKNILTSEYSCTGTTECFNVKISTSTFSNFNYAKTMCQYACWTNPSNGMQNQAYILHLDGFVGQVIYETNTMTDIVSAVTSCGVKCYAKFFTRTDNLDIYGTEDQLINNFLLYLNAHDRDLQFNGNTINLCTTTSSLIYINQASTTQNAVMIFYSNTFTTSGTFGYGGAISISRYVDPTFESTDTTTITNLLKTSTKAPCAGVTFIKNSFDKVVTCTDAGIQVNFQCLKSTGSTYFPSLSQDAMVSIAGVNTNTYSYTITYNSANLVIDLNYFNFQSNTISNLLGAIANPVMQIAGFMNVNIKSNTFQNSGRYIENVMSTWSQVTKYTSTSSDSISSTLCTLNAADDTYGFLTVGYSNMVNVLSNTVNNLFFTFGTSSLTATYGSFITFSYVAGPVTITTLTVTGQTGILGDYNLNTIGTLNSASKLTSFGNNMDSYQFVPLFTTDLTNKISPMKITLVTFDSCIGNLASTTLGGLFLTSLANTVNGYIDIVSLQIDQFTSNNCYIYGIGGLIYRVGPMTITNSKVTNYGSTKPSTTASTVSNGPPFANVLRPDNYSKFHTITMQNNLSGQYGASFYFGSDLTQTVTALTTNNFEIFSTTIQSCGGTSSILYINANSLIGQIDDLNLNSGTNAPLGSIYITGGKLTFNRATLLNNVGVTASDLNINLCTSCEVTFTSSSFSRTAIDTTTSPLTWNKVRAIYLNSAGTVTFTGTTFSNYLLVDRGGVIEAHSTKINLQSCTFNQNSADTGGVIYVDTQTTIAITSSTFTNNKANTQSGVLYFKTNCIVTIQSSTFTSNSATSDGLFTSIQYSQLTDVGSTFTSNTATLQNSIASFTQCTGSSFTNSKFITNSVTGANGGIMFNMLTATTLINVQYVDNTVAGGYKGFYLLSSDVTATSGTYNTNSPVTSSTDKSLGGYFFLFGCTATFQSNTFTNGRAGKGGAVFVFGTSYTATSSTFQNNQAITSGGAYYVQFLTTFSSQSETFTNNKAPVGDAYGIRNTNDYLVIKNCVFNTDYPPQFITATQASITMTSNTFEQKNGITQTDSSQVRDGSVLSFDTSVRVTATSNTFKNIISGNGVISLIESSTSNTLKDFYPDLAAAGTKLVTFTSNVYNGCKSYGTVGGGAFYYACALSGCQLTFSSDQFLSCTSSNNGGAVLWTYMKPDGLETCTFSGNKAAVYGNDIAAVPQKLMVVPGTSYTNKVITNQRSGGAFPKLTIGIYDTYGQIVSSLNDATLTITVTGNTGDTYPSFISQPSSIVSSSGVFTFDNVVTTGTPGITQTVFFKSTVINENIPTNAAYLSSNHLSNSGITFTVGLRKCIAGESFLSDGQCSPCEAGVGYLMTAPTTITSCTPCPISYAYCLGGNTLGPKAGFWRPNLNTDTFLTCETTSACLGYTSSNKNYYGACSEGYIGTICGDCDYGYSRTNDFECGRCPNYVNNSLRIAGFIILMIVILVILVKTTINGAGNKRNVLGVYNRILVNHVQMITIIYSFKLEWPSTFTDIFKTTKSASEVTQQFISFDCFIDQRSQNNMDANPIPLFYYKLFLMTALPLIIMIICYILWSLIYFSYLNKETPESRINSANYKKNLNEQKDRRIVATSLIVLLFIHPSVLNVYFQMFSCTSVDGVQRLNQNLATECYTGLHLYLTLFVAIPAILIWGMGVPCYALVRLFFNRKKLDKEETREEIGYLYNGYTDLAFYWEPVIMLRKMTMVAFASLFTPLGRKIQAMFIFLFLLIVIILQALIFSIYAGVFFVTDKGSNSTAKSSRNEFTLSDIEKIILYLLFVLSNIVFIVYWGFLFLVESRRFFRMKFQKLYHYLCLCNNRNAVNRELEGRPLFLRSEELLDYYLGLKNKFINAKDILKKDDEIHEEDKLLTFMFKCYRDSNKMKKDEILSSKVDPKFSTTPKRKNPDRMNYLIENDLSIDLDFSKDLDKKENQSIIIKSQMNFNDESAEI